MARIYILTGDIRSGKTTALMDWSLKSQDIGGYLTPDKNGVRKLYNIRERSWFPFEVKDPKESDKIIQIGKFRFHEDAFDKMASIIESDIKAHCQWIAIDEVGKLEVKNKGAHLLVSACIEKVKSRSKDINLMLIIRTEILDQAIEKFQLQEAIIISKVDLIGLGI